MLPKRWKPSGISASDHGCATNTETVAGGAGNTLKVKVHYWQDNVVKVLELPPDSDLDLR